MPAKRTIQVLEHDNQWELTYLQEENRLHEVFRDTYVDSHHIGSTSISDLLAKPTIDIAVEVAIGTVISRYDPSMEKLGDTCRGECLNAIIPGIPGRFYFVMYDGPVHLTHTHVYEAGRADIKDKLILRNYLRAHPLVAAAYGQLKLKLASQYPHDNISYMRGKDCFLRKAIDDAYRWNRKIR
ncbi:MAG: GrpB-like predicted nucleotidyltransferase (UPF0157 family) [Candidatus Azotimanducaceae bacterium]|jgi:GrpB-like predicted nucleotidyltransferase (UPF0157 family)